VLEDDLVVRVAADADARQVERALLAVNQQPRRRASWAGRAPPVAGDNAFEEPTDPVNQAWRAHRRRHGEDEEWSRAGDSVVTALTAQNTVGVRGVRVTPPDFLAAQLDAVLDDLAVRAVKTGMLGTTATIALVAARAGGLPNLVVDPVLVSTGGDPLLGPDAVRGYLDELFPHAAVVTPNSREAALLLGRSVSTVDEAVAAAAALGRTGAGCVVVKGGHLDGAEAVDVVWAGGGTTLLRAPRIDTKNNHGTGCTFAAAVTARLARGEPLDAALRAAKAYVHAGLAAAADWRLGAGHGPLGWTDADPPADSTAGNGAR
jgi:hydroxymethylpyrimidine/phosphomethylpyrimidine kinase